MKNGKEMKLASVTFVQLLHKKVKIETKLHTQTYYNNSTCTVVYTTKYYSNSYAISRHSHCNKLISYVISLCLFQCSDQREEGSLVAVQSLPLSKHFLGCIGQRVGGESEVIDVMLLKAKVRS